jgi:hypothetical protein
VIRDTSHQEGFIAYGVCDWYRWPVANRTAIDEVDSPSDETVAPQV